MHFYCLRHPKPDVEPGICYGQSDIKLSDNYKQVYPGIKQSIAPLVINKKINKIYTSPLIRCHTIAQDLSRSFDLPLTSDSRLMEMDFGCWENKSYQELWENDREYRFWSENWQKAKTPGGESLPDLVARIELFLKENTVNKSLIITHSGVIRIMKHLQENISMDLCFKQKIPFGALVQFQKSITP